LLSIWFLGCPFRVVVLPFAIPIPEIRDEVPEKFRNDGFFYSAFAKGLPPSRKAPADKTARQAQNGAKILVTNSDDARFVTEARDRGIMSPKKDAASELAGRRASNV